MRGVNGRREGQRPILVGNPISADAVIAVGDGLQEVSMSTEAKSKPPKVFWAVSGFGLVWNAVGVLAFIGQITMDLSQLPDAERLFFEAQPTWATAGFGIAVASGVLGCVALLLRKSWAAPMFLLCLGGIVVQSFHSLALSNSVEVFGPEGIILPIGIFVIAVFLTWFAKHSEKRGWVG